VIREQNFPELLRISDYLFFHAAATPEREFVIGSGLRLTYAEMEADVTALSRSLLAAGIAPGDRVATLAEPGPDFLLTFLATVDIGAIWVGMDPKYTIGELMYLVDDSRPKIVFSSVEVRGRCYEEEIRAIRNSGHVDDVVLLTRAGAPSAVESTLHDLLEEGRLLPDDLRLTARENAGGTAAAILVYTSGTTGRPKGALLSHASLVWSFLRQGQRWSQDIDAIRIICNLPINHSGCVGDIVSSCLTVGGTLVCMEQFDPDLELRLIESELVNVLFQIPTMYQMMAESTGFQGADLSSLRWMVWGGAALPAAVLEAFARPGLSKEVVYGQTEAPASLCFSASDATVEQWTNTIGRPDPEIELRLVRPDGMECAIDEPGEVQVRHHSVFLGYWDNPTATAEVFTADGFLRTGDQAARRVDGYLRIVGRLREMYKSGGYNVYPREVELCLERQPDVWIAVVVGIPDPLYDEVGHAFVVPRDHAEVSSEDLKAWCRVDLANYKVPKVIHVVRELPMLPIGKPDRLLLRSWAQQSVATRQETTREVKR
jgi:acyl-CoA synthetase (AMP-forming)/AMP-acid ligase II